eukprot:TRINITY_DN12172_c0_g1_i4.p1 TRINITY_DN12172_c0_g1~~TRINITY_DN12172_c0_g1_i4.p1  ORF type:complete len:272 (+),score=69.03 TRINITY_DN12172_c0_g1_i4:55-816(+)
MQRPAFSGLAPAVGRRQLATKADADEARRVFAQYALLSDCCVATPEHPAARGAAAMLWYCQHEMRDHRRRLSDFLGGVDSRLAQCKLHELGAALHALRPHGWDEALTQAVLPELLPEHYMRKGRSALDSVCQLLFDAEGSLQKLVAACGAQLLRMDESFCPDALLGGTLPYERALGLAVVGYACIRAFRQTVLGRPPQSARIFGSLVGCAAVMQRPLYCLSCCTPWCTRDCQREEWSPLRLFLKLLADDGQRR